MDDEAQDLALLDIVKAHNADIAVAVSAAALVDFAQDFLNARCVKQGQLPQRPVVLGGVRNFVELDRRNIALIENVLNLLGNLLIAQGRQVGKRFKALFFAKRLHGVG